MTWQEFLALLVLATAMSFTPGPNTTLSTALAASRGLRHALPFVFAVPVGWSLLLLTCALGLGAVVLAAPALNWGIKLLGAGYLLWLAYKLAQPQALSPMFKSPLHVSFWQGVALQFVNIKAWMLALSIVSGWIAGHTNANQRLAIVVPVMLAYALASNLTYAIAGSLLRQWLSGPKGSGLRLTWFNRILACVLVVTAAWMVTP